MTSAIVACAAANHRGSAAAALLTARSAARKAIDLDEFHRAQALQRFRVEHVRGPHLEARRLEFLVVGSPVRAVEWQPLQISQRSRVA